MKSLIIVALALVAFAPEVRSHMCLLSPRQRGSMMNINVHATPDCILMQSPCGNRPAESEKLYVRAGQNFTVIMQKNADHWKSASPGDFTIRFGQIQPGHVLMDDLAVFADKGEPSLSIYPVNVRIPANARGQYVIQADYRTNNPDAPSHFYQCADIMVL